MKSGIVVRTVFAGAVLAFMAGMSFSVCRRYVRARTIGPGSRIEDGLVAVNGLLQRLEGKRVCNKCVKLVGSGQLMYPNHKRSDMADEAVLMTAFSEFCRTNGVGFLYVLLPKKLDMHRKMLPPGLVDVAYDNADDLLRRLDPKHVMYEDWRPKLAATPEMVAENFYISDLHWNNPAARQAAHDLVLSAARICGVSADSAAKAVELLEPGMWHEKRAERCFLGTLARRTGPYFVRKDDVAILWPRFDTRITVSVPDRKFEKTGTFLEVVVPYYAKRLDVWKKVSHSFGEQYAGGAARLVRIGNPGAPLNLRVMIIGDSFSRSARTYLSVAVREIVTVDPRRYDPPLDMAKMVLDERPDIVIQMHTVNALVADALSGEKRESPAAFDYGL